MHGSSGNAAACMQVPQSTLPLKHACLVHYTGCPMHYIGRPSAKGDSLQATQLQLQQQLRERQAQCAQLLKQLAGQTELVDAVEGEIKALRAEMAGVRQAVEQSGATGTRLMRINSVRQQKGRAA